MVKKFDYRIGIFILYKARMISIFNNNNQQLNKVVGNKISYNICYLLINKIT